MTVRPDGGFLFDADEQEVLELGGRWARRQYPLARFDSPSTAGPDWAAFADSGLLELRDDDAGEGRDLLYCGLAYQMGRQLAAEAYIANSLVAALLRSDARSGVAHCDVLAPGRGPIHVAYCGGDGRWAAVFGTTRPDVSSGAAADAHGIVIDDAEIAVVAPRPAAVVEPWPAPAVTLSDLPDDAVIFRGRHDLGALIDDRTYTVALLARAAGLAGAGAEALASTIDHVQRRHLFGRTLGSFQTVQHRLAAVEVALTAARATIRAVTADGAARRARAAWRLAAAAAVQAAGLATQLHGGLGVSWELPIHLFAKSIHRQAWASPGPAAAEVRLADLAETIAEVLV